MGQSHAQVERRRGLNNSNRAPYLSTVLCAYSRHNGPSYRFGFEFTLPPGLTLLSLAQIGCFLSGRRPPKKVITRKSLIESHINHGKEGTAGKRHGRNIWQACLLKLQSLNNRKNNKVVTRRPPYGERDGVRPLVHLSFMALLWGGTQNSY